jgi:thioredoxin-like negative regulator of GroEL
MWQSMAEQWENSWRPKAAFVTTVRSTNSDLLSESEMIRTLEEILEANPKLHSERIILARRYREAAQNTNALREYKRILRETEPDDAFLEEAADFFDSLNLSWEANNTRERISNSKASTE